MTTASSTLSNATSRAADSVHKAVDTAASAAAPAVDRMASRAHSSVDKAASAVNTIAATIEDTRHELEAAGSRYLSSGATYVRDNPLKAIGIAAAVGFLISRITR